MSYIDGFVLAVPAANKDIYIAHASTAADLFKKLGATRLVETWAEEVPHGKQTDFYRATKLEEGEVPLFSWIEYPDRATRMKAGQDMMNDPDMPAMSEMPFDASRMIYGGFEVLNEIGTRAGPFYVDAMISPVPAANNSPAPIQRSGRTRRRASIHWVPPIMYCRMMAIEAVRPATKPPPGRSCPRSSR